MRFGSLFSGIEAASAAWLPLGWSCAWVAEIDPFACAVLKHRYPAVPNLGDITKVDWHAVEPVDLVAGGPPCQDFSVAGRRAGIEGERGNLSLEYVRALDAIDPAWSITENVPGWLSMGDNAFGRFLAAMVGSGAPLIPRHGQRWTDAGLVAGPKRTAAWRILDAQFHGVPQRRRRVFVVAVRGAGNWRCAGALFPQQQSLPRNSAPRREAGQGVARPVASCAAGGSGYRNDADTAGSLIAFGGGKHACGTLNANGKAAGSATQQDAKTNMLIVHALRADGFDASEDGTGRGTPLTLAIRGRGDSHDLEWRDDGTANAILTPNGGRAGIGVGAVAIQNATRGQDQNGLGVGGDAMFTLDGASQHAVGQIAQPLRSNIYNNSDPGMEAAMHIQHGMSVRRLTPRECERLQGLPDDYTLIPYRGKPAADAPRYRAIGNSMAVPVVRWIGERIQAFEHVTAGVADAAD